MDMRGTHFYTSTFDPSHPLHYMQTERRTPRNIHTTPATNIHTTPATHYKQHYDTLPPTPSNSSLRTHIHTTYTKRAIHSFRPNSLLGTRPPPVASSEAVLPRPDRVHLSRLRCGHHPSLPSYMHRIGRAALDLCNFCSLAPGFRLPHPTTLPVTTITQGFTSHTLTGPTVDAPSGLRSLPEGLCVHIGPHTPHTASPVGSNLGRAWPPTRPSRQGRGLQQQQQHREGVRYSVAIWYPPIPPLNGHTRSTWIVYPKLPLSKNLPDTYRWYTLYGHGTRAGSATRQCFELLTLLYIYK